jgi:carbamoyltransferase
MKDVINAKIKFREEFRPFAPAVLYECADQFFETSPGGRLVYPYMLATVRAKQGIRDQIPAVIHVDGTSRVQTIDRETNPRYWQVIEEYRKLSGLPVVLNTSFNVKSEPIVCSPSDAIDSFLKSDLDYVLIGDYLLKKRNDHGHT